MIQFPSSVSRTLDLSGKSLLTLIAQHDSELGDMDFNGASQLSDLKRQRVLNDQVTSGCLTYSPMVFNTTLENTFTIPSFDVLFNGEVVTITGNLSGDLTVNRVTVPPPPTYSIEQPAQIYVVFLEMWYQSLDPTTGQGYYTDPVSGDLYYYPHGGVNPDPTTFTNPAWEDDSQSLDANNQSVYTTARAQIQWRLNVQSISPTYDFTKYKFGLDPGAIPSEIVYAQASLPTTTLGVSPLNGDVTYQFTNMGTLTGDTALWQAGDGNVNNSLGTMDGYSYATPIAAVFQRNTGAFNVVTNIFGCADAQSSVPTGLIAYGVSGRFDSKLADQIFPSDVVDTRQTIDLSGWDYDKLVRDGFSDLVLGNCRGLLARGEAPGLSPIALGSTLDYYVSMAPTSGTQGTTDVVGSWDGFANGFSSDTRTYQVSVRVSTNQKVTGTIGGTWSQGDTFAISLPISSPAVISTIGMQALVGTQTYTPVSILPGQVTITGLGTASVAVNLSNNLTNTPFDPGSNPIYVTLGVTYPAGSGVDLKKSPIAISGGWLVDSTLGNGIPVFGTSEYEVQSYYTPTQAVQVTSINPKYSDLRFGTKIWINVSGSLGVPHTLGGVSLTTFTLDRTGGGKGLDAGINGLYPTDAWDSQTGAFYTIASTTMSGSNAIIVIQGSVPASSTMVVSFLAQGTAQIAYNAAVRGVTVIEETVLFGNYNGSSQYPMDSRVALCSVSYNATSNASTVVLGANNAIIKGISGNGTNKFVWISEGAGNLVSSPISQPNFTGGVVSIEVPNTNLTTPTGGWTQFLFCGSILPALSSTSSLVLQEQYTPYQGEGVVGRDYEVLHVEDSALITTNGTGAAPVPGISDVYPYNRELPIISMLPSQVTWSDSTLTNTSLATLFDSNYVAMRMSNVEHTFLAPLHTNDFIPPMNRDIKKSIRLVTAGGSRGFSIATPHVGFAIAPPVSRSILGQNLQATTTPIVLYVNNVTGSDSNDGLSSQTAKATLMAACSILPPVIFHPCAIRLANTGMPYSITKMQPYLQKIPYGDGVIQPFNYYAMANLSFDIQQSGRLLITRDVDTTAGTVTFDATGYTGFGDGPTSAFFVNNSRVVFNGIQFKGFTAASAWGSSAVTGVNSEVEFISCSWVGNLQAASFDEGSNVIVSNSSITLANNTTGFVVSQSTLTVSNTALALDAPSSVTGGFFIGERNASLNLQTHSNSTETNISNSTVIAEVELNSSIVTQGDFSSNGMAVLQAASTLSCTPTVTPFIGGVKADSSCSVLTQTQG